MNPNRTILAAAVALLALATKPAAGEDQGAGRNYNRETYPYGEIVDQPLTLPASVVRLELPSHVNTAKDEVGKPWYVPATLDIGVTDDVQVGVFHARGLCLAGTSNGCAKTYDDVGGRAVVSLSRTYEAQLAVEGNVLAFRFADTQYQGGLGLAYKRSIGNVGLQIRGGVEALFTDRSTALVKELAFGEAVGAVQLGHSLAVLARIGVDKGLEAASGVKTPLTVPVAFGAEFEPIRKLAIGGELEFANLLGDGGNGDERELVVFLRLFI